jgi:hypothetical protein
LCITLPDISLLILGKTGPGMDNADLIAHIQSDLPDLPLLYIGPREGRPLPTDVQTLESGFTPDSLLEAVAGLIRE